MTREFDLLTLVETERQGGGGKTHRKYFDFVINHTQLSNLVAVGDQIGLFGWLGAKMEKIFFLELMLKQKSQLSSGRVPIYICPECGDLGCGCISIQITTNSNSLIWSDFGYENNYEGIVETYPHIREYKFNKQEYQKLFDIFA